MDRKHSQLPTGDESNRLVGVAQTQVIKLTAQVSNEGFTEILLQPLKFGFEQKPVEIGNENIFL